MNGKTQLIVNGQFTVIYSNPVVRYDDDGRHFVLVRDPMAINKPNNNNYDIYQKKTDIDYKYSLRPLPSIKRFITQKESLLDKEIDEIHQRIENINREKQEIDDKLARIALKKQYLNQQNKTFSGIYDLESKNNAPSEMKHVADIPIPNQPRKSRKRVVFDVDFSESEHLKLKRNASNYQSQNSHQTQLYHDLLKYNIMQNKMKPNVSSNIEVNPQTDIKEFVGFLEIKIVKIQIDPRLIAPKTQCIVRMKLDYEGSESVDDANTYNYTYNTFYLNRLQKFKIQKIFKNCLSIQVSLGNFLQDEMRLLMVDLTKTRAEKYHKLPIKMGRISYKGNVLHINTKWRLQQFS